MFDMMCCWEESGLQPVLYIWSLRMIVNWCWTNTNFVDKSLDHSKGNILLKCIDVHILWYVCVAI
jgi:hypothetical protein